MEAVEKVASEVDKVITKFTAISDHSSKLISDEIASLEFLKSAFERKTKLRCIPEILKHIKNFRAGRFSDSIDS